MQKGISIIIPIFNEDGNISPLYERLIQVLERMECEFEIIFVNDGSKDESAHRLNEMALHDRRLRVIHLRRNFGQTAAMVAGIDHARGEIVIPMDGDMQNDPADIPRLVAKLNEGYDLCSGWRKNRQDSFITRSLPSKMANKLISMISGVHLHDYGCSLKAYKRKILDGVKLYGEMHRFIPIYASWNGAKVTEIPVAHHRRFHGESKYGIERTAKVVLDLIVIKFLSKYSEKPMYVFGTFGFMNILLSLLSFCLMLYYKFFLNASFIQTPLPLLTVVFFLIGILSILMGLLAEIIMRTYHESQDKTIYVIDKKCNFEEQ